MEDMLARDSEVNLVRIVLRNGGRLLLWRLRN
jgi:hypothetical protein